jgi:hypothetical protein
MKEYIMKEHQSWGDKLMWLDYEKMKMTGWKTKLKKQDTILCEMQSGKIARFEIKKIHTFSL